MRGYSFAALLALLLPLGLAYPRAVTAQEYEEEEDSGDEEGSGDEEDSGDEEGSGGEDEEDYSEVEAEYNAAEAQADADAAESISAIRDAPRTDMSENTAGLESDPLYKLDSPTAKTFEKMTTMERENAVMKLQIEQEKLKLDLKKQLAEKKKVELALEDEEANRALKKNEAKRKQREAERKFKEEEEEAVKKSEQKKKEDEINQKILERVSSADFSNPEQLANIAQLMSMTPGGAPAGLNALLAGRGSGGDSKIAPGMLGFDKKYVIKSIVGAGGSMTANVENVENKTVSRLRAGSALDGWTVDSITRTSILFKQGDQEKTMSLNN
jgi:chemotaxis protein histidine kinase CheA